MPLPKLKISLSVKLAGIFFQLATKIRELEPRPKVAKVFCQWLRGDRNNFRVPIFLLENSITLHFRVGTQAEQTFLHISPLGGEIVNIVNALYLFESDQRFGFTSTLEMQVKYNQRALKRLSNRNDGIKFPKQSIEICADFQTRNCNQAGRQ